jgi:uncharacterized protein (DUF2147 family)
MQELRLKRSGNEGRGGLERSAPRIKTASNAVLKAICIIVAAGFAAMPLSAQSPTPVGVWLHPNKRIQVEIAPCGERLCGKMVWFRWPNDAQGLPLVDLNNPNPELRSRPLLGLRILRGLRRAGERTWEGGKIYNPDDGVEYRALMSIGDDGALRVRAYLLLPILGKTLIWTRVR